MRHWERIKNELDRVRLRNLSRNLNNVVEFKWWNCSHNRIEEYGLSNSLDMNDFQTFKDLMNSYPHPSLTDVENYKKNPNNKVTILGIDYGGIDDRLCGTINEIKETTTPDEAYPKLVPYLNAVLQYEEIEQIHTHKGSIYFNIGQYLFKKVQVENALYFIHRGLIEMI